MTFRIPYLSGVTALLLFSGVALRAELTASPNNGDITLPAGFKAVVVAEGLSGVRGVAVAPNGDV